MAGAIPTEYGGIRFRSRLEATWAAFFDLLGWSWEYEPIDLSGYIPDFILRFIGPVLVEVKPEATWRSLWKHQEKIERSGWRDPVLIVCSGLSFITHEDDREYVCLGLSGVPSDEAGGALDPDLWGGASLHKCGHCQRFSPRIFPGSNPCLICGSGKIGTFIPFREPDSDYARERQVTTTDLDGGLVRSMWATAKNRTQWRGEFGK